VLKKIVFLGGKNIGYECLRLLFEYSKQLNIDIIGVDGSPRCKKIKEFSERVGLQILNGEIPKCNVIISVQYHRILSSKEILAASERAVNLHMAPLPEYRGCNQFSFAIIDEVDEFGTTLHEILPGIDSGPIIAEKRFKISRNIWVKELFDLTYKASLDLFEQELPKLIYGEYRPINQVSLLSSRGVSFHFRKEIESIKKIDLNWSNNKIKKYLRATMMPGFEMPYTMVDNTKVYFSVKEYND
jgi:methionyl-tRNA formyltransferase